MTWGGAATGANARIELSSNGRGNYVSIDEEGPGAPDPIILSKDQVHELGELMRSNHACELTHDPAFVPGPAEAQTTLELSFDDQSCKVTLWDGEWQRGTAHDIMETMRSMRPHHRPGEKKQSRQLNPRQ